MSSQGSGFAFARGALVALLVSFWGGCAKEASIDEHRVRAAVREYNLALPGAYRNQRPEQLAVSASAAEVGRVGVLVAGLARRDRILDSRRETAKVETVSLESPRRATLLASEVWWYRQLDSRSRMSRGAATRVRYRVRYHLEKVGDRWLIDRLTVLKESKLAGGRPRR